MQPPWFLIAEGYLGMKELPGKAHNPTILGWLKKFANNIGRWGKSRDETPWCSVFVSHCLETCGIEGTRSALARSWIAWGRSSKPRTGAIVVIKRRSRGKDVATGSRAGFHVGFLKSFGKGYIEIRGGNQRNKVSDVKYSKRNYELIAIRWPEGFEC